MARFLADECFSGKIVSALRNAGFDVVRSGDVIPAVDDQEVLDLANRDGRVLLTEDYDFGDLVVRLRLPTHGVVIVAVKGMSSKSQCEHVVRCLTDLADRVEGALVTIEPARARVRPID